MIPEAAKRFVEQTGFDEKSRPLLSGCFVHRCRAIHLLRRDVPI
jgi:dsRNA-specific ribonuclease